MTKHKNDEIFIGEKEKKEVRKIKKDRLRCA